MKPSVLIVDDEKVICDGIVRLLGDGYTTYKALNGFEALDILSRHKDIDVMLCDLKMPGIDGGELIDEVRAENKEIYIIVITAAAGPHAVCDAMRRGANSYLRKPLEITNVEKTVWGAVQYKSGRMKERSHISFV